MTSAPIPHPWQSLQIAHGLDTTEVNPLELGRPFQFTDAQRAELSGGIPLARLGEPADIAAAVLYLVAPAGAYLTGKTLHVNGGMYMP